MNRHDVHACLVSAEATPNLTPALDAEFRPREVILIASPEMGWRADALERTLRPTGVHVTRWHLADSWNVQHVHDRMLKLLLERETDDLALNVTGGTKPMAIAAHEVFRDLEKPVFYVHPERDEVVWLYPPGRDPYFLRDHVKLPAFLNAHGYKPCAPPNRAPVAADYRTLAAAVIGNLEQYERAIGTLNWLAGRTDENLRATLPARRTRQLDELLTHFTAAGLVRRRGAAIEFANEEARFLVNGGWLEQHIFAELSGLRRELGIQDLAQGLEVESTGGSKNELDIAFLADNRLYIVECKTRKFPEDETDDGPGSEILYKLDTLRAMGGIGTRGLLVSYRDLSRADRQRARDLRIRTVVAGDLRNLPSRLSHWVSAASTP